MLIYTYFILYVIYVCIYIYVIYVIYVIGPAHQAQRKMKMKQLEEIEGELLTLTTTHANLFEEEMSSVIKLPTPAGSFDKDTKLICIENVSFGYTANQDSLPTPPTAAVGNKNQPSLLFEHVEFSIYTNSRVVILGKNGSGKTSFLNLLNPELTNQFKPVYGEIKYYPGCKITMLQQHHYKGKWVHM